MVAAMEAAAAKAGGGTKGKGAKAILKRPAAASEERAQKRAEKDLKASEPYRHLHWGTVKSVLKAKKGLKEAHSQARATCLKKFRC